MPFFFFSGQLQNPSCHLKDIHVFNLISKNLILLKDWSLNNKALGYICHTYSQSLVCLGVISVKMADWVVCVVRPLTGFVLLLIRESEEAVGGTKGGERISSEERLPHQPAQLLTEPCSREWVFKECTESLEMMFQDSHLHLFSTNVTFKVHLKCKRIVCF